MSSPANRKDPDLAGSTPAIALISVLFPAPLGPITVTIEPSATSIETSHSAVASP